LVRFCADLQLLNLDSGSLSEVSILRVVNVIDFVIARSCKQGDSLENGEHDFSIQITS
jgi:hypothetical protein